MDKLLFHKSFKDESPSNTLNLVVKNYMTKDGVSRKVAMGEHIYDSYTGVISGVEFQIKGPMGKGLDLEPRGVHVAFTAGTGVLPFLDLVAYLIRININEEEGMPLLSDDSIQVKDRKDSDFSDDLD
jgi:hypothetical protein